MFVRCQNNKNICNIGVGGGTAYFIPGRVGLGVGPRQISPATFVMVIVANLCSCPSWIDLDRFQGCRSFIFMFNN